MRVILHLFSDGTVGLQRPEGRKIPNPRVTVMFCCNSDGTDKHQIFCIGTARNLQAFKKAARDYELA